MSRFRMAVGVALLASLTIGVPTGAATPTDPNGDLQPSGGRVTRSFALVQLKGAPLSTSKVSRPEGGGRIEFDSASVRNYRAKLAATRNEFKQWLRGNVPAARVTGEFDVALHAVSVKLNGATVEQLRASALVARAEYQGLYHPLDDADPDLALIDAVEAWRTAAVGGDANAGEGVEVAIVDSGIDVTHSCFDDAGYPDRQELGDTRFTNDKVVVAKVFYNKARVRGLTAEAIDDHGTHVAGTVGCNLDTPAVVDGVDIPYDMSGVAPRALLGNYNVFPGEVGSARSEDILDALEEAYEDGMDVANMSLGGGASGKLDLLTIGVDNLDLANMVVAVAAGNSGPGRYTVGSPGSAARALTAGASTVGHFVGAPVTVGARTFGAASGDFAVVTSDLTAPLGVVTGTTNGLNTACTALSDDLTGQIALISRGVCTFSTKIRNAEAAGAVAVLVANNVAGDPTAMGADGTPGQPTIPAYMISRDRGQAILAEDGASTTISADLDYFQTGNDDIMAGFSSQGPTDVDFRVKPDVVAPGVNVLSSVPHTTCDAPPCFAFFQGTSMATPHLAGSAAVVRGAHPGWSAAEVRSAIVNTAERGVLTSYTDGTTVVNDVNVTGSGRENLLDAVGADVALDPVSISFGATPAGAGQTRTFSVELTNLEGSPTTLSLSISGLTGTGVSFSLSDSTVSLAAGESTTVTVTMAASRRASLGGHQAWLEVDAAGENVGHAAIFTFVK